MYSLHKPMVGTARHISGRAGPTVSLMSGNRLREEDAVDGVKDTVAHLVREQEHFSARKPGKRQPGERTVLIQSRVMPIGGPRLDVSLLDLDPVHGRAAREGDLDGLAVHGRGLHPLLEISAHHDSGNGVVLDDVAEVRQVHELQGAVNSGQWALKMLRCHVVRDSRESTALTLLGASLVAARKPACCKAAAATGAGLLDQAAPPGSVHGDAPQAW